MTASKASLVEMGSEEAEIAQSVSRRHDALLLAALFLGALDQTVVAAILPQIVLDLRIPLNRLDEAAWMITSYLAGYALVLPVAGQMADRSRGERVVLACLGLFAVGSAGTALFGDLRLIVASRAVQALGAGALLPVSLARAQATPRIEGMATRVGLITAVAEAGSLLGPAYGALAIRVVDWRWIFLLNVPVTVALAAGLARGWRLPRRPLVPIDWIGGVLLGICLSAAMVALSREGGRLIGGMGRPLLIALVAVAVFLFLWWERRAESPLIAGAWARQRRLVAALSTHLFGGAAFIFPLVLIPVWGNTLMGRSPAEASLLLLRLMATIPPGALLAGALGRRLGPAWVASVGMTCAAAAIGVMSSWGLDADELAMTAPLLLAGFGFGLMLTPTNTVVLAESGADRATTGVSLLQSARLLGMALGGAFLAGYGLERFGALVSELSGGQLDTYLQAMRLAAHEVFAELFRFGAALGLASAVAALFLAAPRQARSD